jgi:hypothetical protein
MRARISSAWALSEVALAGEALGALDRLVGSGLLLVRLRSDVGTLVGRRLDVFLGLLGGRPGLVGLCAHQGLLARLGVDVADELLRLECAAFLPATISDQSFILYSGLCC